MKYMMVANTPEEVMSQIKLWIEACLNGVRDIGGATEQLISPVYESQLTILNETSIMPTNELPSDL